MMWFKNLIIYRLTRTIEFHEEILEKQLADFAFTPCGSQDSSKFGWVPVISGTQAMLHKSGHHIMLCAYRETKILPAAVIKQAVDAKVAKLEAEQQRMLRKAEKDTIRDEVLYTLLPRAFSKYAKTMIWIDTETQRVVVNAGSAKQSEDVLALLRKTIGSLPVVPLSVQKPIELTLTEWVRSGELPAGFSLLEDAELKSVLEDGGVIRCKQQELDSDEIASHINAQKLVTKLALDWQDRISFMLCDDASIKRIKFADELREQNDDIDREDPEKRFDADFALMTGELNALFSQMFDALGGEGIESKNPA
ncbi:recombination-associated protein RdgC [Plesiomonas shigelloides]|uniref:recombination-associated protein RdgC n=1 Tax=Plesiomonas shigelloides TaxID=703 RepID=UPI000A100FB6|nr:recombination-associated protein RdgC [Plesiomonas shigelloides]